MNRKTDKLNILALLRKILLLQTARKPQQDSKFVTQKKKKDINENLTNIKNNKGGIKKHAH